MPARYLNKKALRLFEEDEIIIFIAIIFLNH